MGAYGSYLLQTFVTLVAVCALAFVVLWGARRLGIGRPSGAVKLVGHLPLDARRAIYLIKVGRQVFVVGVAEGGMTKIGELRDEELPEEDATDKAAPFADVFAKVLGAAKGARDKDAAVKSGTKDEASK
jgi:flagellar protein FliO/FliZ